jgi:citrate synthase
MTDRGTPDGWLRTGMGAATASSITVAGHDLASELMGVVTLSQLAFRFVAGRFPDAAEARLFDAVLVSLADHGITPSVLAARLTYVGAPEALQGAVAAGILGGGSVFLGVTEDTARFLQETLAVANGADDSDALTSAARGQLATLRARGGRTPGLGHPVHKDADPRVARLYGLAAELALLGPHLRLLEIVAAVHAEDTGRRLPINGAGAAGAALADLGFDWTIARGFALLARTAGVLGHLAEEMQQSLGLPLWHEVEERSVRASALGDGEVSR